MEGKITFTRDFLLALALSQLSLFYNTSPGDRNHVS